MRGVVFLSFTSYMQPLLLGMVHHRYVINQR